MIRIAASPYPGAWAPSHEHYQAGVSSLPHRRLSLPRDLLGPPHVYMSRRKYHCLLGLSSHIEVAIFLLDPWCYRSLNCWGHGAPALHAHGFPISQKKYLIMVVFSFHLLICYHRHSPKEVLQDNTTAYMLQALSSPAAHMQSWAASIIKWKRKVIIKRPKSNKRLYLLYESAILMSTQRPQRSSHVYGRILD